MTELLSCPFCGGEAETLTAERTDGYIFWVMCHDCCSCGDGYDTEAEAIEAWNTRAIVRCKDCKHYTYSSWHRCDLYSIAHEVEPDGFCAWGERETINKTDDFVTHDSGECENVWDVELTGRLRFQCSECGAVSLEITPRFCPCCGRKVVVE